MSYEGYTQVLCKNGHSFDYDVWDSENPTSSYWDDSDICKTWRCRICGKPLAWWNSVDETNCDAAGFVELEIDTPEETCVCDKCGVSHTSKIETYKIPKSEGHLMSSQNLKLGK
jgi:hypothetical protein